MSGAVVPTSINGLADTTTVTDHTGRSRSLEGGTQTLDQWRAAPSDQSLELRDPGLARLLAEADERTLAAAQLAEPQKFDEYEQLHHQLLGHDGFTTGMRLALEAGIEIECEYIRFWSAISANGAKAAPAKPIRRPIDDT